jgi:hypothetical protein
MAFVYGDFKDLDPRHLHVFAYTRTLGTEKYLVVENFSSSPVTYTLPNNLTAGKLLLSDIPASEQPNTTTLNLAPWESRIYNSQVTASFNQSRTIFHLQLGEERDMGFRQPIHPLEGHG